MNNQDNSSTPKSLTPTEDVASFYMKSRCVYKGHLPVVRTCLDWLIQLNRRGPIGSVGFVMVYQALASRNCPNYSCERVLKEIRLFLRWCQREGYLPKDQSNPADLVYVARMLSREPAPAEQIDKLCAMAPDVVAKMKTILSIPLWRMTPIQRFFLYLRLDPQLKSQIPINN